MTINSSIDTNMTTKYYSNMESDKQWIQPSIISQKLANGISQLIDGLYVQVTNTPSIGDLYPCLEEEFMEWETASNYDLLAFENKLESEDA